MDRPYESDYGISREGHCINEYLNNMSAKIVLSLYKISSPGYRSGIINKINLKQ